MLSTTICSAMVAKMLKLLILLSVAFTVCLATPAASSGQCGQKIALDTVLLCIKDMPDIMSLDGRFISCFNVDTDCEQMTCIFEKSQWLNGTTIVKDKVVAYYDQLAKDNRDWAAGFNHAKDSCFDRALPVYGPFLNCPAYDATHCVLASLIKHAPEAKWWTRKSCTKARSFAAACPICPAACKKGTPAPGTCSCITL